MRFIVPLLCLALAGCVTTTQQSPAPNSQRQSQAQSAPKLSSGAAARNFRTVVARVEPVAERECRARTNNVNCDFDIRIDERANQPPNAFQTLSKSGRPIIVFNVGLIGEARNQDELAFVLGHEASHHIRQHIAKQQQSAVAGALIAGVLASIGGAGDAGIQTAQDLGGTVGARAFSKDMELEADSLGAVIAHRAGYDPRRGAEFFFRIPDPGDRFLGTHPPNAERRRAVNRVASQL